MGNRIITGIVITIITNFILNSCHAMEAPKQILEPYSKKQESHYSYNINGNKLIINSKISDGQKADGKIILMVIDGGNLSSLGEAYNLF